MTTFIQKREDDNYVLNGAKCFITNASLASQFTVFCKVGKPTSQLLACVVVPAPPVLVQGDNYSVPANKEIMLPTGGRIIIGKPEDKLGQHLSNTASVTFEEVVIAPHQIIGDRRKGFTYV